MARFWTDKDGNGKPLTDGRVCLVITSDEPNIPDIRTYGRDKDEVLDKLARTTETAQATINRLRKSSPASPQAGAAPPQPHNAAPATSRVSADEQAQATVDLSNPAKAPEALKTLLRAGGVDIDEAQRNQEGRRIGAVCLEWERRNPEFPLDPRNQRMLVDRVLLRHGVRGVSLETLDAAYRELLAENMFFELAPEEPAPVPPVQPRGSEEPRAVVRTATTHRRNSLRSPEPSSRGEETAQHREWRKIFVEGNSKQLRDAMETMPGFKEWADKQYAKSA